MQPLSSGSANLGEGATREGAANQDLEDGSYFSNGSVKKQLCPQGKPAPRNALKKALGGFPAPVEWIRSHPWIILVVLILLVVVALVVALSVQSAGKFREIPVIHVAPRLLGCPDDWIGYNGICYFLSRDHLSWDQAQARCSELGASLAVLRDEEMEFLFCLSTNIRYWIGLRRQGEQLQWENGSSFNSSIPVLGKAECVFLTENHLGSVSCSEEMPFVCSRPHAHLG